MFRLEPRPYLLNAFDYWSNNFEPNHESLTEDEFDRDFTAWLYPIYNCKIYSKKHGGLAAWIEFENESDMTLFALRWS
jgi:hypothetical protein